MQTSRGSEWRRWDLHVHTASSYDSKYKADDADDLLCQTLRQNEIAAVAITDHFKIDKERIKNLRSKTSEIVFFPGVELRTDKGANNLHLILIFSEESDLDSLSADFDAIMMRQKAKSTDSNETIYWEFSDIVEFATEHDALISIHAGHKANGIDKEISNSLPVKEAIKSDIAESVHFFEIGQKRDIASYEDHVFKCIDRKPLIMCSDCHNPNEYSPKEYLWIKADLTFEGLKQCVYQPLERVFIGDIPPVLDRLNKNKQGNICSISCSRKDTPANGDAEWFDFDIPLNPGMVAVIGNKGSGKSAFSDIIGLLCRCNTMSFASFLQDNRFRKAPKKYAGDYSSTITWFDGVSGSQELDADADESTTEDAQYLPQQYIERVCNDLGREFQEEIDKVIFSYVDRSERGEAQNLDELVRLQSKPLEIQFQDERAKLKDINSRIIALEKKKTNGYQKTITDCLSKAKDTLDRHERSKPSPVERPEPKDSDVDYQDQLAALNQEIQSKRAAIDDVSELIRKANTFIGDIKGAIAKISYMETQLSDVKVSIEEIVDKYGLDPSKATIALTSPVDYLEALIDEKNAEKADLQESLSAPETGLYARVDSLEAKKSQLISTADAEEKAYQRYLSDLAEWEKRKAEIIGDVSTEGSVRFYEHESAYILNELDKDFTGLTAEREKITRRLFQVIIELAKIHEEIYAPVQGEVSLLLGNLEDNIVFQAEIYMQHSTIAQEIRDYINQRYKGKYGRASNSIQEIEAAVKSTNFSDEDSVIAFVRCMEEVISSDYDTADDRVPKRQEFYDFIYGLEYIGVSFKLKMGNRSLEELSPGERGIVLLIFYLALSKESKPIIIDQPEDNLDNQSVYSKLVPCICKAKQMRQVIIVTHNPNIAVACDAEQIIYCEMDKQTSRIQYESGSIENPKMRGHVVDVLEGTMPAFDLRRRKYH